MLLHDSHLNFGWPLEVWQNGLGSSISMLEYSGCLSGAAQNYASLRFMQEDATAQEIIELLAGLLASSGSSGCDELERKGRHLTHLWFLKEGSLQGPQILFT